MMNVKQLQDSMNRNMLYSIKKAACVVTLGVSLTVTGNVAYATSAQPVETTATTEVTAQTAEVAQNKPKIVQENGQSYYKDASGKKVKNKFVTVGKKTYYFGKSGAMEKGWMKKGKAYYYLDRSTGVLKKKGKVDGISINKNGTAKLGKDTKKKIETMILAKKIVKQQTKVTDSKQEKLKKSFDWVMKAPYKRYRIIAKVRTKKNWDVDYANDIFKKGKGCCVSMSSAFAYLAKECGYSKVYLCDDSEHAWVEINGKVYDVLFARAKSYKKYFNSTYKTAKLVRVNKLKI